ncbi:MAG: hypothetical protein KDA58_00425 [Planctomycetaceae bacterium]|nr:hypothetical protein [Planctomycetaceae bacterium]
MKKKTTIAIAFFACIGAALVYRMDLQPSPPSQVIVVVSGSPGLSGEYLIENEHVNEFLDEVWANTGPDDWQRIAWYSTMHVYFVDESGSVYSGYYLRPTQVRDNGASFRFLAQLASRLGERVGEEVLAPYRQGMTRHLRQHERSLRNFTNWRSIQNRTMGFQPMQM